MSQVRYLNFPVIILKGFLLKPERTLRNILYYAIYSYSLQFEGDMRGRLKTALEYYNLTTSLFDEDIKRIIAIGERYRAYKDYPHTGLGTHIYLDFIYSKKTHYDRLCLLAYLALKSILGNSLYCKTNNRLLFARMAGEAKASDFTNLPPEFDRYIKSRDYLIYWSDKLRGSLEDWYFVFYSRRTRGFYASLQLSLDDLAYIAESNSKANRDKIRKQEKRAAYLKAVEKLGVK